MSNRTIIIKLDNNGIGFNDSLLIPLDRTNLPYGEFQFVQGRDIFYEVEMRHFDRESGVLTVSPVQYRPQMIDDFLNQSPKAVFHYVHFQDIFWPGLSMDLAYFKKSTFASLLTDISPENKISTQNNIVNIHSEIPFTKLRFGVGFVAFDYRFRWEFHNREIRISNPHLLPEFEYVKSYFSKHFNRRTIDVLMVVKMIEKGVEEVYATSKQIDQIKEVAIETLKFIKIDRLKNPKKYIAEIDKRLFTPEDLFDPFNNENLGTHSIGEEELLEHIMTWKDIRNKKQIEYLAGALHEKSEKIRFSLTPQFGFIFMVKGRHMTHYIWEMLNSHATYVWGFDNGEWAKEKQLAKIEEIISFIRNHGRDTYVRRVAPDEEILFHRIRHNGGDASVVDSFPRWRHTLVEILV